jgi:hypothetical protein
VYVQKSNTLAVGDKFPQSNKVVEPTHRLLLLALLIRHLKFFLSYKGAGTGRCLGLSVGCQSAPSHASHPMPDLVVTYLLNLHQIKDWWLRDCGWFAEWPDARRPLNTTWPWNIRPSGALASRLDVLRDHGRDLIQESEMFW